MAQVGTIVRGDLDSWTFPANAGDNINLQVSKVSGDSSFAPQIDLYAPIGSTGATLSQQATSLGT